MPMFVCYSQANLLYWSSFFVPGRSNDSLDIHFNHILDLLQVAKLFRDHEDLLEESTHLLPVIAFTAIMFHKSMSVHSILIDRPIFNVISVFRANVVSL